MRKVKEAEGGLTEQELEEEQEKLMREAAEKMMSSMGNM